MDASNPDAYALDSLDQLIGCSSAVSYLRAFAADINKGVARRPLILHGPPGTGKTAAAHKLAEENGWNVVEMSAADYRDRESIERRIVSASTTRSLFGARNLILLDEIDELAPRFDKGASAAISRLLSESKNPVIFIANNMWDQSIVFLRGKADGVEFRKLTPLQVSNVLNALAKRLGIGARGETMDLISGRCAGDVRSAINDFIAMHDAPEEAFESVGLRDRKNDIFVVLDKIFSANTMAASMRAAATTESDLSNDMLINWIEENLPKRYKDSRDLYNALTALSDGSAYLTRANRSQYYTYWRYMKVLVSAGVTLSKSRYPEITERYTFPRIISQLSKSKEERNKGSAIAEKLQRQVHTNSKNVVRSEMRLISQIAKKALEGEKDKEMVYGFFMRKYSMSDDEVDWIAAMN
ncbi:MAG: replication factor C large subunit [Candidatus Micrarchaeota archaeon]|nr:replication factor C large subunit [Candidatus Micrarchaeota archaeon]